MDPVDCNDPTTRAVLEAARAWGVPWRVFLGWSPTTTTIHEYDDAGRLVRTTTTTEPLWGEEDRNAAMSLLDYEAGLCPGCAHPLAETTAPEMEFGYTTPGPPIRCHRCTKLAQISRDVGKNPDPGALLLTVIPKESIHSDHQLPA